MTACPGSQTACSGFCDDTTSDVNNCGGCGNVCPSGTCSSGKCVSCVTNGGGCKQGSDCCSGLCAGASFTCVSCIPSEDVGCQKDSDCCTGFCNTSLAGFGLPGFCD